MDSPPCIEQKGVIEEISDELARVRISSFAACAYCHARKACGIPEGTSRVIEVSVTEKGFSKGDPVYINMKRSMGLKAAVIAYIVPFVIVITSLLLLTMFNIGELFSGTISLVILIPYFTGLYFFRDRLKRSFIFTMKKAI